MTDLIAMSPLFVYKGKHGEKANKGNNEPRR